MSWIVPPPPDLHEFTIAPEIYVENIGALEFIDGNIRAYLYAEQLPLEARGASQKLVAVRLIGPARNVPRIIGQLAMCCLSDEGNNSFVPKGPRLVR